MLVRNMENSMEIESTSKPVFDMACQTNGVDSNISGLQDILYHPTRMPFGRCAGQGCRGGGG